MAAKHSYLVRGPSGTMATIIASSPRGAVNKYLAKYKPPVGGYVSAKQRGEGDWHDFKVTR